MQNWSLLKSASRIHFNGTVPTEPLLNICGRHWTPKRIRKVPLKSGRVKES